MPAASERLTARKVIYVAGYGRSGSTLLDIALGMHQSIIGVGELTALARQAWHQRHFCACGKPVPECPFWAAVVRRWQPDPSLADEQLHVLGETARALEVLVSPHRLLGRNRQVRTFTSGTTGTTGLLDAICATAGNPGAVIVDSSKLPGRGFMLAETPRIELYVVHLVRDARGVAASLAHPHEIDMAGGVQRRLKGKSPAYVALRWVAVNKAAERLCARVGAERSLRLRYEDLVADPQAAIDRIAIMAGLDRMAKALSSATVYPHHQVAGNRLRMKSSLQIRPQGGEKSADSGGRDWIVSAIAGNMLRQYGYAGPDAGKKYAPVGRRWEAE